MSTVVSKKALVSVIVIAVVIAGALTFWGGGNQDMLAAPDVDPPEPVTRLISKSQYTNTLAQIFGPDVVGNVRFAPVARVDGLVAVGASTAVLTSGGLDPLYAAARSLANTVVGPTHREFLIPCQPESQNAADDVCARQFFGEVGRLLYRQPLTEAQLTDIVKIANNSVGTAGDFYDGLAFALTGMLISPQFLYIRETIEPSPDNPAEWRLDGYSKASRLSFLLWDSSPDDELLRAAESGELHTTEGLERQVERMIDSPLYRVGVKAFFNDFFVLEAFDTLTKDTVIYPSFTLKAAEEAREQILRTAVDHLVDQHGEYPDLFTTRRIMMSSDLAALYKIPVNLGSQGWIPYEFSDEDSRAGLLSQIGFLAQYSHPGRSSPTLRGRGIREVLLCQKVPDPPPEVDFSLLEDANESLLTARERLDIHNADPTCAGCHAVTDPIGLGLENFDGAGQFRMTENGAVIDPSGVLDGIYFDDSVGVGQAVRDNPALTSCLINRLYAYSVGRQISHINPLLDYFEEVLDQQGYEFDNVLRLMIYDKSFFAAKPPMESDEIVEVTSHALEEEINNET